MVTHTSTAAPENKQSVYAKTKAQISCAVTAQWISAFVFAERIAQSFFFFLNPKFQASNFALWLYSLVCVGPKTKLLVSSCEGSLTYLATVYSIHSYYIPISVCEPSHAITNICLSNIQIYRAQIMQFHDAAYQKHNVYYGQRSQEALHPN